MLPFSSPQYPSSSSSIALPCLSPPAVYHLATDTQLLESCPTDPWTAYAPSASGAVLRPTRDSSFIANDPTLYAPVPVAGQPSLLFSGPLNYNYDDSAASSAYALCNADTAPAQTFPTPSELLVEMTGHRPAADPQHCNSNRNINDLARRSRRRPLNRSMGLIQSDSRENITSHEKKRHYLECLEHYILYLRQQLQLVGAEPVPLQRVQQYRGLSNRSIRTLLVHMENSTRKSGMRIETEEQRFVSLRDTAYGQDVGVAQELADLKVSNGLDM